MQTKASNPIGLIPPGALSPFIEAYFEINHLKQLYRQGWLQAGIPEGRCESVADHSFSCAVLALFLANACFPNLDANKVVRMILIHELGEVYAGDLTPNDAVSPTEKHQRERESVLQILSRLPEGAGYIALWDEFEANETPEAQFVHQVDRLEMGFQACIYQAQLGTGLPDHIGSTKSALQTPLLQDLLDELLGSLAKDNS